MKNLLEIIKYHPQLPSHLDVEQIPASIDIKGITATSSLCDEGFLFVATKKATPSSHDGHDFIDNAINQGACAVVVDAEIKLKKSYPVPLIVARDSKKTLCHLVEAFYDFPSHQLSVIGITGTNGKTSTSFMLHSILQHAGFNPKIMGTLGLGDPYHLNPTTHTTLEPEFISKTLAQFAREAKATHVIMEVSSHALSLQRTEAIKFSAVGLSNITEDHLDFHGSIKNYQAAKARLFFELAHEDTHIVLPDMHPFGEQANMCKNLKLYGPTSTEISFSRVNFTRDATTFLLHIHNQKHEVTLPFLGDFHVFNASLAASLALSLGVAPENIVHGLKACPLVPGRLEPIATTKCMGVFVDFAHTPDGLRKVLTTLRQLKPASLIVVFGCGGDRDQTKRPLMGSIAEQLADVVIITDDNPRHEAPGQIRSAIIGGTTKGLAIEIPDRKEAIEFALTHAKKNDIVIIAGKGHETYQIYGDDKQPFNDAQEARKVLESL